MLLMLLQMMNRTSNRGEQMRCRLRCEVVCAVENSAAPVERCQISTMYARSKNVFGVAAVSLASAGLVGASRRSEASSGAL